MFKKTILQALLICFCSCGTFDKSPKSQDYPFRKDNLIPWSIVSFDVKERSPKQRIAMLQRLGFNQYAYGNRPEQQESMRAEIRSAKAQNVDIKAVWLYINLNKDTIGKLKPHSEAIFEVLKGEGIKTQIWVGFQPTYFDRLSDDEALEQTVAMVDYLSERAKKLGCKIALYNHGGWFGRPENQLKIIRALDGQDIGIVYNFHHGHEDLEHYSEIIKKLLPYLWCVNLNGMKAEGPKILTIGQGNLEQDMIQQLLDLDYKGPFGILGHVKGGDPEVILQANFEGLQKLFSK